MYTSYRIPSGTLKGLRFGGGMQFQGPRIIGVPQVFQATSATAGAFEAPDPLATIKSQSTNLASAMVGYDFKIWQRRVRAQLNVSNLFDKDDLIYVNVATYTTPTTPGAANPIQGHQIPNRFRYLTPRTFTLTVGVDL